MYREDTIAAISTPSGEGGIAVIRVSGPDALASVCPLLAYNGNGGLESHRFYYDQLRDSADGAWIDEVMVVFMGAPRSYTREDVVEVHCHGGTLVAERILLLILSRGARLAEPGEFTRRAFLNGRIDLVQAEAVIDIIRSRTDAALELAQDQRRGLLSARLSSVRSLLVEAVALLEAWIDFPEEDIDAVSLARVDELVAGAGAEIDRLLAGFEEGRVLRDGVSVLIAGKPNVGKSSLLNILLREKRAIVTAIPGTTRDTIEEIITMGGLPVRLIDTAGIRSSEDLIEQEGVRLTLEKIPVADLVLFVLDRSRPLDDDDQQIRAALQGKRTILVVNKADLPQRLDLSAFAAGTTIAEISTHTGEGIDRLRALIVECFLGPGSFERRHGALLTRVRHRDSLATARQSLLRYEQSVRRQSWPELSAVDLREALDAVGLVTGQATPDEILDVIFGQFCIGK